MKTQIISGFPGIGKTTFARDNKQYKTVDLDGGDFSKSPDFPQNYIDAIKSYIGKVDIIFCSTHAQTRRALKENGLKYAIVYPDVSLYNEYMERYRQRDNTQEFLNVMEDNWVNFIEDIDKDSAPHLKMLKEDMYLSNVNLSYLFV